MRKLIFAAVAATFAFATVAPASAEEMHRGDRDRHVTKKIVIHRGDRGRHEGWRHRDVKRIVIGRDHDRRRHEGWRHHRHGGKTIVIKKREG